MNERERVILGGLLHDIGKFYMRTGQPAEGYGREEWREDTGAAGAHARWSASFFSQYVPSQWREAGWLALTHHAPKEDPLSRVVQEADHLAASFDRTKRPTDERGDISRDRLEALCEQIVLPRQGRSTREPGRSFAHALQPLGLRREAVFPGERWPEGSLQHEYGGLWDAFTADAGRLGRAHEGRPDTFDAYVTTLLGLLERYTWCVPSATYRDYPNIPLYDHLKVTAAVAVCLHATDWVTDGGCRFLFVEGDLGGIQAFLYESAAPSQTQEGTAQRLRGKSFFLDLAMRTLAERLRRDLELPTCNILWCSGGHFALLAPDTSAVREAVARFREVADRWCWEEFLGDVGVAVAAIPATDADLADVRALLERAGRGLTEEKHRRFATRLRDSRFWTLPLKNEVCRACGRDVDKRTDFTPEAEAEDAQKKCPRCREFEAYGQRLPRTGALGLVPYQEGEEDTAGFPTLGLAWRLLGEGDNAPETTSLVLALGGVRNRELRFLPQRILPSSGYGVTPYSTILPMDGPRPRTFDRMAECARGAPFLGVLRMDVDNLGAVFALGVPAAERSLSKLAALSRIFDWFFRGWVPVLAAEHDAYVTYSGGDDLFLVGPWDRMVHVALEIEEDFRAFGCGNTDLTLSGGLALVKGRFPIGRAAERSEDLLNGIAKRPRGTLPEDCDKASLAVFNRKVPWPVMRRVWTLAEDVLIPAFEEGKRIRRSALHHWLRLHRQYFEGSAEGVPSPGAQAAWFAKLLYGIIRNVPDTRLAMTLQQDLASLSHWIPVLVGYTALRLRRATVPGGVADNAKGGM
jgi:CRISPR-associated protein Csm1